MTSFSDFSLDHRIVPGHAPDGSPILSLLAKASYVLVPGEILRMEASVPAPLTENDTDVEMDLVAWKSLADMVVVGRAHAPRGKRAKFFDVGVMVDGRMMQTRIFGRRTVDLSSGSLRFTEPEPFESMALGCDLAYGGTDAVSDPDSAHVYPPNPLGKGYRMRLNPEGLHGLELPNLEDPNQVLTPDTLIVGASDRWRRQPKPRFFGCVPRASFPRCDLAGLPPDAAMDAQLAYQKSIAASGSVGDGGRDPVAPPKRMDPRFYNSAHELLQFPYLEGTESVRLSYMDPDHPLIDFELPGVRPEGWLDVGEGPQNMEMILQSVEIRPDDKLVHLIWRGACAWSGSAEGTDFTRFEFGLVQG
jgi:hypothetical protein